MAKQGNKLTTNEKIGIAIGVLLLIGGGGFMLWHLLTKKKRECIKAGGKWDSKTKSCILPEKPKIEQPKEIKEVKEAFDNLTFISGSSEIASSSFPSLDKLVDYLKKNELLQLRLEGHTDSQGDDDYNQQLSEKRALAVENYIVSKGIDKNRVSSKGFGETKPIATNTTSQGREKNRRVEFILK